MRSRSLSSLSTLTLIALAHGCSAESHTTIVPPPNTTSAPSVHFAAASGAVVEGAGPVAIEVVLDTEEPLTTPVEVTLSSVFTTTATKGKDYRHTLPSREFPVGSKPGARTTLWVAIDDDDEVEGPETIALSLSASGAATVGTPSTMTLTIADDESPPTATFVVDATETSETGDTHVEVMLVTAAPLTEAATVSVTTAPGAAQSATLDVDYVLSHPSAYFPAGSENGDTQDIVVTVQPDLEAERQEVLTLALEVPPELGETTATHSLHITDDDLLIGGANAIALRYDTVTARQELAPHGLAGNDHPTAAAFDTNEGRLYVVAGGATDQLTTVDTSTGAVAWVTPLDPYDQVHALAYDPNTHTLYGVHDVSGGTLFAIDTTTMAIRQIGLDGALGLSNVEALAFDSDDEILYAVSLTDDTIYTVSTTDGSTTSAIGQLGQSGVRSLTYDKRTRRLFGANAEGQLVLVGPSTGAAVPVLELGSDVQDVTALAFDSTTDTLWFMDDGTDWSYEVNAYSGAVSRHALLSASATTASAYDANSGTLYGIVADSNALVRIDQRGQFRSGIFLEERAPFDAATFDPSRGELYAYDHVDGELVGIDPASGRTTSRISVQPAPSHLDGMAWVGTRVFGVHESLGGGTQLVQIDPTSGTASPVGAENLNHASPTSLAYDADADQLYGHVDDGALLVRYDRITGSTVELGVTGGSDNYALAYDSVAQRLVGPSMGQGALCRFDDTDGAATVVGRYGIGTGAMTYDHDERMFYVSDRDTNAMWAVMSDFTTARFMGATESPVTALAFFSPTQQLFASTGSALVLLDTATLSPTVVGSFGANIVGMTFAPGSGLLLGTSPSALYVINKDTAEAHHVGDYQTSSNMQALAIDPLTGALFGASPRGAQADPRQDDSLFSIDMSTGAESFVRRTSRDTFGLAYAR